MIYSSSKLGIGTSASDEILGQVGADLIITPLPLPAKMLPAHIKRGAMFCVVMEEVPIFDTGYDDVLERLMLMQRKGLSTQQSVLMIGVDLHVHLRQAMNVDFQRAWAHLGGRVELFIKGELPKAVDALAMTVPVLTAENQFLRSMPGFDARIAAQMNADNDNRPILPFLIAVNQSGDEINGINKKECRDFVGLNGTDYLIQGEYHD